MNEDKLGLFAGSEEPDPESVWKLFSDARAFNQSINLNETVKVNENFYIGKQWEGVDAKGLPTPQFNFIKRVVGFITATITSDNIKVNASVMSASEEMDSYVDPIRVLNVEFEKLFERLNIASLIREFTRNAAVDGDGCMYTYWDADMETGQDAKGGIKTEVIENTRVFFGNPNDKEVQSQPWIIIERREMLREAKLRAQENGIGSWDAIQPDDEENSAMDYAKKTDDKVTVLLVLWRDRETGKIWAYETTEKSPVREKYDTGIKLYPITWLNWDFVRDSYHGQAMITGLIPNQIFVNKIWALSMLSFMKTAYPKYIYDKTRIQHWDNRVGGAIGITGGDVNSVAKVIDPAVISPQVSEFIQLAVSQTEESLGATSVALGDTRPDNTSAIIALQKAASTPTEITKQNLYKSVEDLARIYMAFISNFYGVRTIGLPPTERERTAVESAGITPKEEVPTEFDFSFYAEHPMSIKLDVGASSYFSELASMQTLDNLLMNGHITALQYLERIPDGYIPGRRKLINELKSAQMSQMAQQMPPPTPEQPQMGGEPNVESAPEVQGGSGYSHLARVINETGKVPV